MDGWMIILSTGHRSLGFNCCLDGLSFSQFAVSLSSLLSCFSKKLLNTMETQPCVVMVSSILCPLIKPFIYHQLLFHTLCPCLLSSLLFLPCHLLLPLISSSTPVSSNHLTPFQIHPHQLADSAHFNPEGTMQRSLRINGR